MNPEWETVTDELYGVFLAQGNTKESEPQIIQIIAANEGWRGIFALENKEEILQVPVLCWALVEDCGVRSVVGIGIIDIHKKEILDYHNRFLAYIGPGESVTSPDVRDVIASN